jgi:N-dimethylarginine dimethylaminohydrolase
MKVMISKLPKNPWWGHGTPMYENNPAMKEGNVPHQDIVEFEMDMLSHLFHKLPVEVVELDFPHILDQHNFDTRKHDFVFVRDLFISNQKGEMVISCFRERARQMEADIMDVILNAMGYKTHRLSNSCDAYAEGGEFYYCKNENILFAGECRNNRKGSENTAALLNADQLIILKSEAFHLDTIFTPVFDKNNDLSALLGCTELMTSDSQKRLRDFARKNDVPLVEVSPDDAIGTRKELGDFSVNCLPLPGILVGPCRFRDRKVEQLLQSLGVLHVTVPLTQYRLSGGAVHCATNEL